MPAFEFPVKLPRYTKEEFDVKKAEYVAKYGYTMYIPGFEDIVKYKLTRPPTEEEVLLYRAKDVSTLGQVRYDEIKELMAKKKEAFLRMMSSPTPTWINNIGTSMTFLDDINDAAGTLSVVCRIGAHLLPSTLGKVLLGPAGWALTIADIANVGMTIMRAPLTRITSKSSLAKGTSSNPFCKEARVARSERLKRIKPTKGEIIEGLQTTNQVFGVGLSLGPLVGAFIEAFTGPYRVLQGKKVTVKWPIPSITKAEVQAVIGLQACQVLNFGGQELSEEDHMKSYAVANMATQLLWPLFQEYHPLDQIEGIENIILTPRQPTDPLTRLMFEEEGIDYTKHIGFNHAEDTQSSATELMDIGFDLNPKSFDEFSSLYKNSYTGLIGSQSVNDFAQNSLALFEGEEATEIDYHPVEKALFAIMDAGYRFKPETTEEQLACFAHYIMFRVENNMDMTFQGFKDDVTRNCRIRYTTEVPEA